MVCLIGANGAGKTSTLKALVRMIPSRGEIHYGNERIEALPGHDLIGKAWRWYRKAAASLPA
jgi:branched-chain amino acid transport system ATP-binding protein